MREILFRGKRVDNEQWVYGGPCKCDIGIMLVERLFDCGEYDCYGAKGLIIDETTIGQYTGLKDKNGNMIFEGDILHIYGKDSTNINYDWNAIIEFGNPNGLYNWGWQLKPISNINHNVDILLWVELQDYVSIYCEIIGNIYDNPELLKSRT